MKRLLAVLGVLCLLVSPASALRQVIVATGQSNPYITNPFPEGWIVPSNLWTWRYHFDTGQPVGFLKPWSPSHKMNVMTKFAADYAAKHPDDEIYLIDIAYPGQSIRQWLPNADFPDMRTRLRVNVEAALAALDKTRIDLFLFWQGEAEANNPEHWLDDRITVEADLRDESWMRSWTPMLMFTLNCEAEGAPTGYDYMNSQIRAFVYAAPTVRKIVNTCGMAFYDTVHLNAEGQIAAAAKAAGLVP